MHWIESEELKKASITDSRILYGLQRIFIKYVTQPLVCRYLRSVSCKSSGKDKYPLPSSLSQNHFRQIPSVLCHHKGILVQRCCGKVHSRMHISDLHYLRNEGRPMKQQEKNSFKKKALVSAWFLENPCGPKRLTDPSSSKTVKRFSIVNLLMTTMQLFIK